MYMNASFTMEKWRQVTKHEGLLADELKANIPGIEYASAIETSTSVVCEAGDKILKMDGVFAGSDFFTMFSYPLLQGTPKTVLNGTVSIAISRRMAEEFFGSAGNASRQSYPIRK